jgi:hypothetical protein
MKISIEEEKEKRAIILDIGVLYRKMITCFLLGV